MFIVPAAPGWSLTSQGCYSDSTTSPQFTYKALTQSNMLTIDLCTRACSSAGFLYAAAQVTLTNLELELPQLEDNNSFNVYLLWFVCRTAERVSVVCSLVAASIHW